MIRRLEKEVDADVFQVMRYTPPFANEVMAKIKHYDEIYAIPMYPHYSNTTTKSSIEDLLKFAKMYGIDKKIKTIDSYFDDNLYNKVISVSFRKFIRTEKKFSDLEHLKKQIKIDIKKAK